ncbi:hypothetical protein [Spiroplasma endosymbiont of Danaus chrysippus]|uniref:hypothetical protein n=1 Tax=Spiroplasma endosymbiont of Danaus chrysippus TaxID=2691041 RepID=UPI00157B38D7|nr:hypothetical protein [Spiroplasma endosymbiont of Danaus chrysippus]
MFQKTKPIIEKCTTFHITPRNPIGAYVFCDNKHNRKVICKLCFENHYQPTQQLAYQEAKQKWKEKNNN